MLSDVAKTTISSACAALGKHQSSSRVLFHFFPPFLFRAASTMSTKIVNTIGLCGSHVLVLNFLDVKCPSLISKLRCSHSFEIHAKCCFLTPCYFILFRPWFLSTWWNDFFKSTCAAKSGMSHSLASSAAIRMLSAPCSGWLSFT